MTTYLVTGGSGYFGSLITQRLHAAGESVRVLDLNDAHDRPVDVEFIQGDVRDMDVVRSAVDGVDVVLNNVAQVPLAKNPHLLRSVNVDGTANLLGASADAGVGKVVHTSSSAVFGVPKVNPVLPTTVPSPMEAYGDAKLAAEWACLAAAHDGLDVSIVRPRTILGHGRLGIFGILFDWIADGHDPIVLGDGTNRYQFVHSDDLADVCLLAASADRPSVFNVGTDRFGTMHETLDSLCAHAGTGARVRSLPAGPAGVGMSLSAKLGIAPFAPYHWMMYSRSMWFDLEHLHTQLGWSPQWSTADMFAQSYDWFLAHRSTTGDTSASHHRRTAQQGVLQLLKRVSSVLPLAR
ncbi:MAG: NAD-dependent epimerase/dehydratase family protein [Ilumatobacter sp.]|nr:NAD-dependent epimerase/dehydratase family protein [Ilumatobacter sp.]MDG2039683.1 NAD-dependent epimerase/dehydratase family protein [Ilumatobacter sp.]